MPDPIRIPIVLTVTQSNYTLTLVVGAQGRRIDAIVDTGSSMLAVLTSAYDPAQDSAANRTQIQQSEHFGSGLVVGPVVQTRIGLAAGSAPPLVTLAGGNLAVSDSAQGNLLAGANGILGLAFAGLTANTQAGQPAHPQPTLLDQLVAAGQAADKFAFAVRRAVSSQAMDDPTQDPVNRGTLVIGGGDDCTDLYTGAFITLPVTQESAYGVVLQQIAIGAQTIAVPAPGAGSASNAIVDSGNPTISLAPALFTAVVNAYTSVNGAIGQALRNGGGDQTTIDRTAMPPLDLTLQAANGATATLSVPPANIFQFDGQSQGQAFATIDGMGDPARAILGLPLFAGRFVVFDRSAGPGNTVVSFADLPVQDGARVA